MTHYNIYLGRNCSDGSTISDDEMELFIRLSVVPKFASFSVCDVTGYWNGQREITTVLTILAEEYSTPAKIESIAREYKSGAQQEAVLIESHEVSAKLI